MNVALSAKTQKLLQEQMDRGNFSSPDEVVWVALQALQERQAEDYEELDADTRAAIEEAEAEYQRGEARPWAEVREELRARFIKE